MRLPEILEVPEVNEMNDAPVVESSPTEPQSGQHIVARARQILEENAAVQVWADYADAWKDDYSDCGR